MRTIHWLVSASLALSTAAAMSGGCADSTSNDDQGTPTGSGGSGTSLASSGGAGGNGGAGGDGGSEVCAYKSEKAEASVLDLIMLVDRSKSMSQNDSPKWAGAKAALGEFFESDQSAGINAGILFFPVQVGDACSTDSYTHLVVPIAPLPENAFNLTNAFPADTGPGTQMPYALEGALKIATARQDANPTHKVAVVLTTDGSPCCCNDWGLEPSPIVEELIDAVAAQAESARKYNGVRTYTVGVEGANMKWLDEIAAAGGTEKGYDVTGAIGELQDALDEVRKAALGCEFELPPPPGGEELVPDLVNFTYTPGGSSEPITLPRADNLADCGDAVGWYYDNNEAPKKILLCPASCNTVKNDEKAAVAAAFGCQSVLN